MNGAPRKPNKRQAAIVAMRVAARDGDRAAWSLLMRESGVSHTVATHAWTCGLRMRLALRAPKASESGEFEVVR